MARQHTKLACISIDIDRMSEYRRIHGISTQDPPTQIEPAYEIGVRRFLEWADRWRARGTLFVVASDIGVKEHDRMLVEAARWGHEIASHSFAHSYDMGYWSADEINADLTKAEEAFATLGLRPEGFRTPGYSVSRTLLNVCAARGYQYDSSVFPCPPYYLAKSAVMTWMWARGKPSGSSMTRPSALIAPLTPYVPGSPLWSTSRSQGLLEIPICVAPGLRLPIIGTSLHLFGKRGLDLILPLVMRTHRDILNMEFHAIDFMDQDDPGTEGLSEKQPDLAIPWTKKLLVYDHFMASISNEYTFVTLREATRRWRLSTAPQ